LISISAVPGGNPVARADPENWAMEYGKCATCNAHFCDRCIAKAGNKNCAKDGTALTMMGPVPVAGAPGPSAPASAPTAGSTKPWWKFWG
jgi:hypothetical protein